jgi:lactam utilization protein B
MLYIINPEAMSKQITSTGMYIATCTYSYMYRNTQKSFQCMQHRYIDQIGYEHSTIVSKLANADRQYQHPNQAVKHHKPGALNHIQENPLIRGTEEGLGAELGRGMGICLLKYQ